MDLYDGNPVIDTVTDELRALGATNQAGAVELLPDIEARWGTLTDREREAVLARFDN